MLIITKKKINLHENLPNRNRCHHRHRHHLDTSAMNCHYTFDYVMMASFHARSTLMGSLILNCRLHFRRMCCVA